MNLSLYILMNWPFSLKNINYNIKPNLVSIKKSYQSNIRSLSLSHIEGNYRQKNISIFIFDSVI